MSRIRCCDTLPERQVRSILHGMGYRFRLKSNLPGRPDIVLKKYRAVIFVHGCFWHRHESCSLAYEPKSRIEFWQKKFQSNIARDKFVALQLKSSGWLVIVVWECELRSPRTLAQRLDRTLKRRLRTLQDREN